MKRYKVTLRNGYEFEANELAALTQSKLGAKIVLIKDKQPVVVEKPKPAAKKPKVKQKTKKK